ncbi:unnamed protein product [Ilex paraguariensis]|uniref:Uncharacterized protein n=1 Tax=Ilex paraguariensis TaxID=185542 RepID=A0ABC8QRY7_9AQUA
MASALDADIQIEAILFPGVNLCIHHSGDVFYKSRANLKLRILRDVQFQFCCEEFMALCASRRAPTSSEHRIGLAGGLDTLTLSSLYDEAAYRASQQPVYGAPAPNPFEVQDPFALSNNIAPPPAVRMAAMTQQQANPFAPYQQPAYPPPQQQQHSMMGPQNPFMDAGFGAFPVTHTGHPQTNNPFGSTGLL